MRSIQETEPQNASSFLLTKAPLLMLLLVLYTIVRGIAGAVSQPLTIDEIITRVVAIQTVPRGIWAALKDSVDSAAPGYHILEHIAGRIWSNEHIALRIPSILAMACAIVCVFLYVRKRDRTSAAVICTILFISTAPYRYFLDLARPYSLVVACFAFLLLCHQRLPSRTWTILFALSLAFVETLHYYAILAMIPFWLSEAALFLSQRRIRWGVWLALIFGTLPLLLLWPLLAAYKAYYGGHYWQHFAASDLARVYASFFWTSTGFGVAIAALAVAGVVGPRLWARYVDATLVPAGGEELPEDVLLVGLVGLPFIAFIITRIMHGEMLDRHVLPCIFGILFGLARIFGRAGAKPTVLIALFVVCNAGISELSFWRTVHHLERSAVDAPVEVFAQKAGHLDLPVAMPDGVAYLPFTYYASPTARHRFVYVTDAEKALQYSGTDNVDKDLRSISRYFPLELRDYSEFVRTNPNFLLYEEATSPFVWLPAYLNHVGATVEPITMEPGRTMYLVTMKPEDNSAGKD